MKIKSVITLFFVFAIAQNAFSQEKDWAVGMRLGEPAGLNIRKYLDENAIEINVGTYGGLWGNYRKYRKGHYESVGLAFNAQYLWHNNLFKSQRLKSYYGFGLQINSRKYNPDSNARTQGVAVMSIGGAGTAGLELYLKNSPVSVFLETGTYAELIPRPLFLHLQSGLGIRYNF